MSATHDFPDAVDSKKVGTYPAEAYAGGGLVWDEVLEYRVWCHPGRGKDDYYCAFATYAEAIAFSQRTRGAQQPVALVLQREYIDEPDFMSPDAPANRLDILRGVAKK